MDRQLRSLKTLLDSTKEPKRVMFVSAYAQRQRLNMRDFFNEVPGCAVHAAKREITYKGHTISFRDFGRDSDADCVKGTTIQAIFDDNTVSDRVMDTLKAMVR